MCFGEAQHDIGFYFALVLRCICLAFGRICMYTYDFLQKEVSVGSF